MCDCSRLPPPKKENFPQSPPPHLSRLAPGVLQDKSNRVTFVSVALKDHKACFAVLKKGFFCSELLEKGVFGSAKLFFLTQSLYIKI